MFFPFTSAVATDSFSTTGSPSFSQIPAWVSFTYTSETQSLLSDQSCGSFEVKITFLLHSCSMEIKVVLNNYKRDVPVAQWFWLFFLFTTENIQNFRLFTSYKIFKYEIFLTHKRLQSRRDFPVQRHCVIVIVNCNRNVVFTFSNLIGLKVLISPHDTARFLKRVILVSGNIFNMDDIIYLLQHFLFWG